MVDSIIYSLFLFFSFWGLGFYFFNFLLDVSKNNNEKHLFSLGFGYAIITNVLLHTIILGHSF